MRLGPRKEAVRAPLQREARPGQGASLLVELDERAHDRRPFRLIVKAAASFRRSRALLGLSIG